MNERDPLPSKAPSMDDERLAALLDGTLDEERRAELLPELAASDQDFHVFAETAAALREIEEAEAGAGTGVRAPGPGGPAVDPPSPAPEPARGAGELRPPSTTRPRRWWRSGSLAALAAAAALVVLVLQLRPGGGGAEAPGRVAARFAAAAGGLPAGWTESRPWSSSLGAGDPLTPGARAVRLGALHVDLALALQAGDTAASAQLVAETAGLLEERPLLAEAYQEVGRMAGVGREQQAKALEEAGSAAADLLGTDFMEAGMYLEMGRIAAARRDAKFFRDRVMRDGFGRIAKLPSIDVTEQRAAERLRDASGRDGPPDWDQAKVELDRLLGTLGS